MNLRTKLNIKIIVPKYFSWWQAITATKNFPNEEIKRYGEAEDLIDIFISEHALMKLNGLKLLMTG